MTEECKLTDSTKKLAHLIEVALKHKQRVWYSEVYNKWLTQEFTTRTNYYLMFDFTERGNKHKAKK